MPGPFFAPPIQGLDLGAVFAAAQAAKSQERQDRAFALQKQQTEQALELQRRDQALQEQQISDRRQEAVAEQERKRKLFELRGAASQGNPDAGIKLAELGDEWWINRQQALGEVEKQAAAGRKAETEQTWRPVDELGKSVVNATGYQPGTREYQEEYRRAKDAAARQRLAEKNAEREAKLSEKPPQLEFSKLANSLRGQFEQEPEVRDAKNMAGMYKRMMTTGDNGPGDLSLLYAYMKMLDPGSAVRESEYAAAAKAGSLYQSAEGWIKKISGPNGGRLPAELRKAFMDQAGAIAGSYTDRYVPLASQYRKVASDQGVNPAHVVLDIGLEPAQAASTQAATVSATPGRQAAGPRQRIQEIGDELDRINAELGIQ